MRLLSGFPDCFLPTFKGHKAEFSFKRHKKENIGCVKNDFKKIKTLKHSETLK